MDAVGMIMVAMQKRVVAVVRVLVVVVWRRRQDVCEQNSKL
jgi:hypothetical protein